MSNSSSGPPRNTAALESLIIVLVHNLNLNFHLYTTEDSERPLHKQQDQRSPLTTLLPFESLVLEQGHCLPSAANSNLDPNLQFNTDVLIYVGGLAWALEFAPLQAGMPDEKHTEILAVAVHPSGITRNSMGVALEKGRQQRGVNPLKHKTMSQAEDGVEGVDRGASPAEMQGGSRALVISSPALPAMGVLAMATGDGCVQVVSVPEMEALRAFAGASMALDPGAPTWHTLRLTPKVLITRQMLGGSMASCLEWQHSPEVVAGEEQLGGSCQAGSKLLVGCWDGALASFRIPTSPLHRLQALFYIRADPLAIWRLVWQPPDTGMQDLDASQGHSFLSVSQSGVVKIWDDRNMSVPVMEKNVYRCALHDAVWTINPNVVIGALEDGSVRQIGLDALSTPISHARPQYWTHHLGRLVLAHLYMGLHKESFTAIIGLDAQSYMGLHKESFTAIMPSQGGGCLWSMSYCPSISAVAYCGEDGILGIHLRDEVKDNKFRKSHAPIGGIMRDGAELRILGAAEAAIEVGNVLYQGGPSYNTMKSPGWINPTPEAPGRSKLNPDVGTFKDSLQTLHCVRFSPNDGQERSGSIPSRARSRDSDGGTGAGYGGGVWLAYGGAAGLVRCQRIRLACTKF
eukprot:gene3877-13941_t